MDKLEIKLRMLTPLWTGGADGQSDRARETGIIGSLRWWYEAVVRGLGGRACDPTEGGCIYKREQGESHAQAYERLCDACKLFGCTGWQRRFRLSVQVDGFPFDSHFCLATLDKAGSFNHWWLAKIFEESIGARLPFGNVNMHVQFLPDSTGYQAAFQGLLSLMSLYGGIGAKTQYGFGRFDWTERPSAESAIRAIRNQLDSQHLSAAPHPPGYYTLRHFWHLHCLVSDEDPLIQKFKGATVVGDSRTFRYWQDTYLPVSFDIRYKLPGSTSLGLRQSYRMEKGKMAARAIFGTLKGEKRGSRVFVSHLYKEKPSEPNYSLDVWGFTETDLMDKIQGYLRKMFTKMDIDQTVTGPQLLEDATTVPQT